jgi:hypothetical protein
MSTVSIEALLTVICKEIEETESCREFESRHPLQFLILKDLYRTKHGDWAQL